MLDAQITRSLLDGMFTQIRAVAALQRKLTEEMVVLHNRIGIVLDLAFAELKVLNYEMNSGVNVHVSSGESPESADNLNRSGASNNTNMGA